MLSGKAMTWRAEKSALIANIVVSANRRIREVAALPGVNALAKAVFLQAALLKMVSDIRATKARTLPMDHLHGRRIAVVEVLDECLTTEQSELLICATIGLEATVARIDALKVGEQPCTRIYVEHERFAVLKYGEDAPLELRMRRQFRQDVQRG